MDPQTTAPSDPNPATPAPQSPTNGAATDQDADVAGDARTVEEVEAAWQLRFSQRDKAHNAAEQVLRDEIASLKRQPATPSNGQQAGTDATSEEVISLRRELENERAARQIDQRRAKYPALAATVGSDDSIFSADEATLAKLNASYELVRPPVMAPTSPKRATPTAAKPFTEKTREELLDDLKRVEPAYQEWQRQQLE